jgi:hypothetical protein
VTPRLVERALWLGTVAALVSTSIAWRRRDVPTGGQSVSVPSLDSLAPLRHFGPEVLHEAVRTASDGNLFRPERRAADTATAGPSDGSQADGAPPPSPKPQLVLRGLLGGPPWDAILEGVPGREGEVVVRPGDVVGGLTIRAIRRDTVIVTGADTTWRLTIGRPK